MITLPAFAKINLSLDITGKREDGYHLLKTVMQTVSICDTVTVSLCDDIVITCSDSTVPCDERNTAYKAVKAFYDYIKIDGGAKIHIDKVIPHEAGMGGASADAAVVIKALNELNNANLTEEQLLEIGLKVGADVPFCQVGGTMHCEGIGEIMTPIKNMPDCFLVVAKPESGISTKEAYATFDNSVTSFESFTDKLLDNMDTINGISENLGNIFLELASNPDIDIIKIQMKSAGALGACMTGSGSAVFGIFDDESKANLCKNELLEDYPFVCICKPVFPDK